MPDLIFYNIKSGINENGNPSWNYKDTDSVRNVMNYILHPEGVNVLFASAIGLPFDSVNAMSEVFLSTQRIMRQTKGVLIRHEVLAFDEEDIKICKGSFLKLMQAAYNCACYYGMQGFQTVYAVWESDKEHIRNMHEIHFVINTVSVPFGNKYHSNETVRTFQNHYFGTVMNCLAVENDSEPCIYPCIPDYNGIIYCPFINLYGR